MYKVGDKVSKVGGDYTHDGEVRSVFSKKSGETRYVVENDFNHSLHIFSDKNLELRPLEFQKILDAAVDANVLVFDADANGKYTQRLENCIEQTANQSYCTSLEYVFKLDDDHNNYVKKLGQSVPMNYNCVGKFVLGKLRNGKYLLGAY